MTKFVTASSGFMIPENFYFEPFIPDNTGPNSFFNRSLAMPNSARLFEFYKKENVYRSETVNVALDKYLTEPSFDNYVKLLDIMIEIFKNIEFQTFFKLQATNPYLSNISRQFCTSVLNMSFFNKHTDFAIVPYNLRFTLDGALTTEQIFNNIKEVEKNHQVNISWNIFLSDLFKDKNAFITFFKYIFADYY